MESLMENDLAYKSAENTSQSKQYMFDDEEIYDIHENRQEDETPIFKKNPLKEFTIRDVEDSTETYNEGNNNDNSKINILDE
jgi:hypothetical protein